MSDLDPTRQQVAEAIADEQPTVATLRPTLIEVDRRAIADNVRTIRAAAGVDVCAVVKADGYGHGAVRVALAALQGGATWLGVAIVEEGERLREQGITAPILVLAQPANDAIERLLDAELTPVAYTIPFLRDLAAAASLRGQSIAVHLKADTGMHRVGVPRAQWAEVLDWIAGPDGATLNVTGLMTHIACADEPDYAGNEQQLDAFDDFLTMARERGIDASIIHAGNTAAALLLPRARHTMVRAGIGIYGLSPAQQVSARDHGLRPALRWTSGVSFAKRIAAGDKVSYGHRWSAPRDGWIATVPVGYADGIPRVVGGKVDVLIGGRRCALVGTVCMDQILVWTDEHEVRVGDEVVLIGEQGDEVVDAEAWAEAAGTITYEITCNFQRRVPRVDT